MRDDRFLRLPATNESNVSNGAEHEISGFNNVTYTYINDGRLSSASSGANTYTVAYDALSRSVKRTLNNTTTYYIYDGEKPILEYDASGVRVGFNLYGKGIDEILERGATGTDNQWHWYFLQQNHEGSVTHLTDASGNVIEKYRYDAFGVPTIYAPDWTVRSSTSYDNRFLFTGREYAATYRSTNTGLNFYEYRARAYNPMLGRFMSEDPKLFGAGDYNLFRYCHNDPEDMTDPMGLAGEATGLLQEGTHDRLWDMTKWFDRSNTLQGMFAWAHLSQFDQDAKGGFAPITKGQSDSARPSENQMGLRATDLARAKSEHDDRPYGVAVSELNGKIVYNQPTPGAYQGNGVYIEVYRYRGILLVVGHHHPQGKSSWSSQNRDLAHGVYTGGRLIPVFKNNDRDRSIYDRYDAVGNRGMTTRLTREPGGSIITVGSPIPGD